MDEQKIRKLLDLMNEYDLEEMEIEAGDDFFRFSRRGPEGTHITQPVVMPHMIQPAAPQHPAPPAVPESDVSSAMIEIKAPMVGTLYRAPSPDDEPFVEVGDHVTPDTTICIIEAMKVMNEVKAEVTGTISSIMVENSRPVEFGQVMFLVTPD